MLQRYEDVQAVKSLSSDNRLHRFLAQGSCSFLHTHLAGKSSISHLETEVETPRSLKFPDYI